MPQSGECRPRVCEGVYSDAEPGDPIASGNPDQAEEKNNRKSGADRFVRHRGQHAEVQHDDYSDEYPQKKKELALCKEVRLTGFVDQFGNRAHGTVYRQVLQAVVNDQAENESENAEQDPYRQQLVTIHAKE